MPENALPDKKITIFMDSRESDSEIARELESRGCVVKKKMLHTADYILSEVVGVERKRYADFLKSVTDQRLFSQLKALSENFQKPILIIEGEKGESNIHPNAIKGAIASIVLDFSIPIIWTKNQKETAEFLFWIAKKEQIGERREISIRAKKKTESLKSVQEFLIAGLPKISSVLARRLLEHFKTPEKIFSASENELRKIKGIGKKLSKKIREVLETEYS